MQTFPNRRKFMQAFSALSAAEHVPALAEDARDVDDGLMSEGH
jgi:hypothetical protein